MASFCHLRVHSEFSIKDGIIKIPSLIEQASKDSGMEAVALTDDGNLYAALKFYNAAVQQSVRPIIGADLRIRHTNGQEGNFTLLCRNWDGYLQLSRWLTKAYIEQSNAVISSEWIEAGDCSGFIVLSGGYHADWIEALRNQAPKVAAECLNFWKKHFPDAYYLELQRIGWKNEKGFIRKSAAISLEYDLPLVATNPVLFVHAVDYDAQQARYCIGEGQYLAATENEYTAKQHFRSSEEMVSLFADFPEAIENSVYISERCVVEMPQGQTHLPQFEVPDGSSDKETLAKEAIEGLQSKIGDITSEYQERLDFELAIINKMGFASYFLIVADFIGWAKKNEIPVGPGRGSGAGSMVAYGLDITDLDPLVHGLLFERFLNPMRVSMPDFDIDFCMEKRDLVIDYVFRTYGQDKVAQIITYGTLAAKAVVRDVGRVLGIPYPRVDGIAKLIPFELGITLEDALKQEPRLKVEIKEDEAIAQLFELALKLEGVVRNVGKHAGGVVIAPRAIDTFMPLYQDTSASQPVTQFDKDDVEKMGLVKFDFLGLRTLTIIDWAFKNIAANLQKNITTRDIALDDEATFEYLHKNKSVAIFQLESQGMQELVNRLQPDRFDDLVALVALYRPGPLQSGMVDEYVDRKHGRKKIVYLHPKLGPILDDTYGVILYQEQVMQIAQDLAGYTLGSADLLRRAMGKKKPEEMAKQRQVFIDGCHENDIDEKVAIEIFDLIEKFAGYGFNKSHSAAYALLTYQTAWLKVHYPASFMAAVLTSELDNTDKIMTLIDDCRINEVKIHSPCINSSTATFSPINTSEVSYGLAAIKGIGGALANNIIAERTTPFSDLSDICIRLHKKINKRALEALIGSGALDSFGCERSVLYASIDKAIKQAEQQANADLQGQMDLLSTMTDAPSVFEYIQAKPFSLFQKLQLEKESLGYYLSGHPIDEYASELDALKIVPLQKVDRTKKSVTVVGLQSAKRVINGKRGRFAFVRLEDASGALETAFFNDTYDQFVDILNEGGPIVCQGSMEFDDFSKGYRLEIKKIWSLEEFRALKHAELFITFNPKITDIDCKKVSALLKKSNGRCQVKFDLNVEDIQSKLIAEQKVAINQPLIEALSQINSIQSIQVRYPSLKQ